MQVAGLVWEGLTNREIAHAIGTTEQVVKNYLRNTNWEYGAAWNWPSRLPGMAAIGGRKNPGLHAREMLPKAVAPLA